MMRQDVAQTTTTSGQDEATTPEPHHQFYDDPEAIGLAVGLIFGIQPTTQYASMMNNRTQRQKMETISFACYMIASGSLPFQQHRSYYRSSYSPTEARSYVLSLRLAQEGFWGHASEILQSRIRLLQDANGRDDESILSIDGMIYVSTFLIDRLYSQTYVKSNGEDDQELETSVRLGRTAVTLAKARYESFRTSMTTSLSDEAATRQPTDDISSITATSARMQPPMESLFANDALRYIHAKLALGKALSLLAQHVGLLATDLETMEIIPEDADDSLLDENVPPNLVPEAPALMLMEQGVTWAYPSHQRDIRKWVAWPMLFFEESRVHLKEGMDACQEYSESQKYGTKRSAFSTLALKGALKSAEGERLYCASSASTRYEWEHSTLHHLVSSIGAFSSAFHQMMIELFQHIIAAQNSATEEDHLDKTHVDATLDCLLRCGKDFGKTCGFGNNYGMDYRQHFQDGQQEEQQILRNDAKVFDFVYLISIHLHGSFHPTTENVERLLVGANNVRSIDEMYTNVVKWLSSEYGS